MMLLHISFRWLDFGVAILRYFVVTKTGKFSWVLVAVITAWDVLLGRDLISSPGKYSFAYIFRIRIDSN